jgi:hypothetical protein
MIHLFSGVVGAPLVKNFGLLVALDVHQSTFDLAVGRISSQNNAGSDYPNQQKKLPPQIHAALPSSHTIDNKYSQKSIFSRTGSLTGLQPGCIRCRFGRLVNVGKFRTEWNERGAVGREKTIYPYWVFPGLTMS